MLFRSDDQGVQDQVTITVIATGLEEHAETEQVSSIMKGFTQRRNLTSPVNNMGNMGVSRAQSMSQPSRNLGNISNMNNQSRGNASLETISFDTLPPSREDEKLGINNTMTEPTYSRTRQNREATLNVPDFLKGRNSDKK